MSRTIRTWLVSWVVVCFGLGCGGAPTSGAGWNVGAAPGEGSDAPSRPVEADTLLFVRSDETVRATTQFEGVEMGTGTGKVLDEEGRTVEYEAPTGQLSWPDEATLRPVDGIEALEGLGVLKLAFPNPTEPTWTSAGHVSGDISSVGETLEIDDPELLPCRTARLLDYAVEPREGDACAFVGEMRVEIERTQQSSDGSPPRSLDVTFGSSNSNLSRCTIEYPRFVGAGAGRVGFFGTASSFKKSHDFSSMGLECLEKDETARTFGPEDVRGWVSGTRRGAIEAIEGLHVRFDLDGRAVDLWLHNPHAPDE
jgi:hypothetical protein